MLAMHELGQDHPSAISQPPPASNSKTGTAETTPDLDIDRLEQTRTSCMMRVSRTILRR